MSNVHAIGPVIKVVGGEALDQVMQGIAYKAGQSFTDQSSLDKARGRWNLEGYQKAKEYETMMNQEERDRWDRFNQEVKSAPIVPNPSKPGWGKIALSGVAFLTGLDLVYNAATAFQSGLNSGKNALIYEYGQSGDYAITHYYEDPYVMATFTYSTGTSATARLYWGYGSLRPDQIETVEVKGTNYVARNMFELSLYIGGYFYGPATQISGQLALATEPINKSVPLTQNDGAIPRVPEPFRNMGIVPGTSNVPDINPAVYPQINPDTIIEIDVPLEPIPRPVPVEVEPLTQTEWEQITKPVPNPEPNPNDNPDNPDKPINPNTPPEKPPYPDTNPDGNPVPEITPEYPEEMTNPEDATQGGLFDKLWEWLKAILDALFKILNAIIALPFTLLELLWDFLLDIAKALFVPSDGFWDKNMDELKKVIWSDEMDEMIDGFEGLTSGGGGFFKDMVVSLMGVDGLVVIDADSINSILDNIHSWVRGVIYPLLLLFNINSAYKMIRGVSLVEATRGLANRSKGAD